MKIRTLVLSHLWSWTGFDLLIIWGFGWFSFFYFPSFDKIPFFSEDVPKWNKLHKLEDALFEQMLTTADWADWTWQTGVNRADRRTGLTDLTSDQATESFSFFSHLNFTTISCHYNGYRIFCHRKWKRVNGSEKVTSYISGICEQQSWSMCFIDHVIFLNWGRSRPCYASSNCCMLFHLCHSHKLVWKNT